MTEKKETSNKVELHFPTGFFGASGSDDSIVLAIRALCLKHAPPERDNGWYDPAKYGIDYEDETIMLHYDVQHYECTCHVETEEKAWLDAHPHKRTCFVSISGTLVKLIEKRYPIPDWNPLRVDVAEFAQFWHGGPGPTEEQKARKKAKMEAYEAARTACCAASDRRSVATREAISSLAKRRGEKLKYDPEWCWEYHCTCGRDQAHEEFMKGKKHVKPCDHWWGNQPNFLHKPTGFEARWYKYIGRDMEYNRKSLAPEEWRQIRKLVTLKDVRKVISRGRAESRSFARIIAMLTRGRRKRRSPVAKDDRRHIPH